MGLRDRFRKGGGGFLNGVDGLLVGVRFTVEPDFGGKGQPAKQRKDGDMTPLWAEVTVRPDGADKKESTHLFAGGADEFVISEDGKSLQPVSDAAMLWGGTAFLNFLSSILDAPEGLVEDPDVQPGETMDFTFLDGIRARFIQVKDEEAMKRAAKSYKTSKGKINELGQKKGSDGKFYDQRTLQVSNVYSVGNEVDDVPEVPATPVRNTRQAPAAVKGASNAKGNAKAADGALADLSATTLLDILGAKKNKTILKSALNLEVTRKLVDDTENREPVRKFLSVDANLNALAAQGIITYQNGSITAN